MFATVGSEEKRALCERLGAERAINYRTEKFADVIRELTQNRGVDVILDMVGGPYLADNIELLREDGRLVLIAALGGAKAEVNLGQIFVKRLTITGSTLRNRSPAEKGRIADALRQHVWPLLEQRALAPVVQATFPLADAAKAHEILEANQTMGKIALIVDAASDGQGTGIRRERTPDTRSVRPLARRAACRSCSSPSSRPRAPPTPRPATAS